MENVFVADWAFMPDHVRLSSKYVCERSHPLVRAEFAWASQRARITKEDNRLKSTALSAQYNEFSTIKFHDACMHREKPHEQAYKEYELTTATLLAQGSNCEEEISFPHAPIVIVEFFQQLGKWRPIPSKKQ